MGNLDPPYWGHMEMIIIGRSCSILRSKKPALSAAANAIATPEAEPWQCIEFFNAGQYAAAQTGPIFLSGSFDNFVLTSGSAQNGTSLGFLSITGGNAFENFDTTEISNTLSGGLSDLQISGTANFNNSLFAQGASLTVTGDTVEVSGPSVFALFGLSLLVLGARARRK